MDTNNYDFLLGLDSFIKMCCYGCGKGINPNQVGTKKQCANLAIEHGEYVAIGKRQGSW